ncbi:MAG: hypothetical protein V2G42_01740 [bacterium JZ-2024 1]
MRPENKGNNFTEHGSRRPRSRPRGRAVRRSPFDRVPEVLEAARACMHRDPRRACHLFLRAVRLMEGSVSHSDLIHTLLEAAMAAEASGSLHRALRILRRSRKIAGKSGDSLLLARALHQTARVELRRGSVLRARRFALAARKIRPDLPVDPAIDSAPLG